MDSPRVELLPVVDVGVNVGVRVWVGVGVMVNVPVEVRVGEGVGVGVDVRVGVGVNDGVNELPGGVPPPEPVLGVRVGPNNQKKNGTRVGVEVAVKVPVGVLVMGKSIGGSPPTGSAPGRVDAASGAKEGVAVVEIKPVTGTTGRHQLAFTPSTTNKIKNPLNKMGTVIQVARLLLIAIGLFQRKSSGILPFPGFT